VWEAYLHVLFFLLCVNSCLYVGRITVEHARRLTGGRGAAMTTAFPSTQMSRLMCRRPTAPSIHTGPLSATKQTIRSCQTRNTCRCITRASGISLIQKSQPLGSISSPGTADFVFGPRVFRLYNFARFLPLLLFPISVRHIKGIRAIREIKVNEEVLVDYGYTNQMPKWYRQVWECTKKGGGNSSAGGSSGAKVGKGKRKMGAVPKGI
jgi:hypothetical protein